MYLMKLHKTLLPPFTSIVKLCVVIVPFLIWPCLTAKKNKTFMKNTHRRLSACLWALNRSSREHSMALGRGGKGPQDRGDSCSGPP